MKCIDCGKVFNVNVPVYICGCGTINCQRTKKFIIDFTVENHGEIVILAKDEKSAREKFAHMIKEHKKETQQFVTKLTYDYSIRQNYCYKDGVPAL